MKVSEHFRETNNLAETHTWVLVSHDDSMAPIDSLTETLSDRIMEHRCIGCPRHYQKWKERVKGGPPLTTTASAALRSFIRPVFGLPDKAIPLDHLEGAVAQYLWFFLVLEMPSEQLVRIERPGFEAIDHGGDGMVVHRMEAGHLMFRLWEIKKCTGESPVSSTINIAYKQLNTKATEYLARYTTIGQELPDPDLSEFYGRLVDLWIEAAPQAAAGVAVAVNKAGVPLTCFTTFGNQFPRFTAPKRLRGMLTAIDDFPGFAIKVQQAIWKGL